MNFRPGSMVLTHGDGSCQQADTEKEQGNRGLNCFDRHGTDFLAGAEMMGNARTLAMSRMIAQAEALGADAVINLRYTTTSIIGSAAELLAYGTAVKLNK